MPRPLRCPDRVTVSLLMLSLPLGAACTRQAAPDRQAELEHNGAPLVAQTSAVGLLPVTVAVSEAGLRLGIAGVPAGSSLECTLDDKPLMPCSDGGLYATPSSGSHKITATAMDHGRVTALGESPAFVIAAGSAGDLTGPTAALTPVLDDPVFKDGGNWLLSKDLSVHVKTLGKPSCDAPHFKCKYDSRSSLFWTTCDGGTFTVAKEQLAAGLQELTLQASCGDQVGPALVVSWYGVPDNYQPLTLAETVDSNDRHVVDLIRQEDCSEGQARVYQCAAPASDAFNPCADNSNAVDKPVKGSRIRLACGTVNGPALSFGT